MRYFRVQSSSKYGIISEVEEFLDGQVTCAVCFQSVWELGFRGACRVRRMEVMELFLAKVPHDKLHMHTPFLDALEVGNLPVVEWLWLRGRPHIDIHWENDFMLVRACEQGRVDMVRWMLRHADFSASTLQRCLVTAACFGYLPLVKYLLSFGWTPSLSVHRASVAGACKHRQLETARWLVAQRDAPGVALNVLKTWSTVREMWILACVV